MHTVSHAHTYTYKIIYAQTSPYIKASEKFNTDAYKLTRTHIYVQTKEHSVHNILLYFQHMKLIVRVSSNLNLNPNPNTSCQKYAHHTNPNPNPNKKLTINSMK